jgi:hypothetical protein
MVQIELWLERDKAMIDPLKTIGIERGKRFEPNAKTKEILADAIQEARAWFEARYDIIPPFYEGGRWFFSRRTHTMRIRSTASPRRRMPMDQ